MLIFGFYIAQNNKNPHVTLFKHCISKTARYSILTPLVKKSYLGDKLLNPEYQVIASRTFIYQQIQCGHMTHDTWLTFDDHGHWAAVLAHWHLLRVRQNGDHRDRWSRKVWIFDRKFYLSFTLLRLLFDGKTASVTKKYIITYYLVIMKI